MKLQEIPRSATFAWSPRADLPVMFTGTATGTIDADFSAASSLEKWGVDLMSPASQKPVLSVETDSRFHDISVSLDGSHVVGALESGVVSLWNGDNLQHVKSNATAHSGPVRAVSFSRRELNKFASAGPSGEVLVWDLEAFDKPVAQGTGNGKLHDEVHSVAWNNTVNYILASAGTKGFCSVWDTRSHREVMHLHHTTGGGNRVQFSTVQWHPISNTKLATASMDDNEPVICVWDLKNANTPEKILRGHTKGVLSLDWCRHDARFMLSGGRDDSTRLWNPETGEELGAYPLSVEWAFKTEFHPTLPELFASASLDGKISVQSLQDTHGGSAAEKSSEQVASSQGDDFWESSTVMDAVHPSFVLNQAPKWLARPVSATFGFGGKLVVAKNGKVVVTKVEDGAFDLKDAKEFGAALESRDFADYYAKFGDSTESTETGNTDDWKLLGKAARNENVVDLPNVGAANDDDDEEEFMVTPQYVPDSEFKLLDNSTDQITLPLLHNDFEKSVSKLLASGDVADALLVASLGGPELVARVQNAYLARYASERPYLRVAWDVSTKNAADLVKHTELEAWPQVLKFVLDQEPEVKTNATSTLVSRLAGAGKRDEAVKAGIESRNAAALATLWIDEMPEVEKKLKQEAEITPYTAYARSLQLTVQKIAVATTEFGLPASNDNGADRLYTAFRDFADLAAQHGDLALAKQFLHLLPDEFATEKQRVDVATAPSVSQDTRQAQPATRTQLGTRARAAKMAAPSVQHPVNVPASNATVAATPVTAIGSTGSRAAPTAAGAAPIGPGAAGPGAGPNSNGSAGSASSILPQGVSLARASLSQQFIEPRAPAQPAVMPPPGINSTQTKVKGWNDIMDLPTPVGKQGGPVRAAAAVVAQPQSSAQIPNVPAPLPVPAPPAASASPVRSGPASAAKPATRARAAPTRASVYSPPAGAANASVGAQSVQGQSIIPPAQSPFQSSYQQQQYSNFTQRPPQSVPRPPMMNTQQSFVASIPPPPPVGASPVGASPVMPPSPAQPAQPLTTQSPQPVNPYLPQQPIPQPAVVPPPVSYRSSPRVPHRASSASIATPPPMAPSSAFAKPTNQVPPVPPVPSIPSMSSVPSVPAVPAVPAVPSAAARASPIAPPPVMSPVSTSSTPVSGHRAPVKPVDPAEIPAAAQPVYTGFTKELDRLRPVLSAQYPKQYKDTHRRLDILYDQFISGIVTENTTSNLVRIAQSIQDRQFDSARSAYQDIATSQGSEPAEWMIGINRLIKLSEGVPV